MLMETVEMQTGRWNAQLEDRLFLQVARAHVPHFPEARTHELRALRDGEETASVCEYWNRMAAHDLFIVRVVSKVIDRLFPDDLDFQFALSRQLGDDALHAEVARRRVLDLTGADPLPEIRLYLREHAERAGDIPYRSWAGLIAFQLHYEFHILAKLIINRKTQTVGDPGMREFGEKRIRPDEECHRVRVLDWWLKQLDDATPERREELADEVLREDEELQRRLNPFLREEYEHIRRAWGADIARWERIYDDWRREILSHTLRRAPERLSSLVSVAD
jgi:hypothetical protein